MKRRPESQQSLYLDLEIDSLHGSFLRDVLALDTARLSQAKKTKLSGNGQNVY